MRAVSFRESVNTAFGRLVIASILLHTLEKSCARLRLCGVGGTGPYKNTGLFLLNCRESAYLCYKEAFALLLNHIAFAVHDFTGIACRCSQSFGLVYLQGSERERQFLFP